MPPKNVSFRCREFAQLAGVTVRALHHYDRLGLLTPARTAAGYRVYSLRDLHTLEQIVVLKFIGIPLRQIAALRRAGPGRLSHSLRAQRATLERKRQLLDRAIAAIHELDLAVASGATVDPAMFKRVIEVIEMQNDAEGWTQQYDELVNKKLARLKALSPEALARLRADWDALVADIRLSLTENPASPKAQALAARWEQLLTTLMGEETPAGVLARQHNERQWTPQMSAFIDKDVWDYMTRVLNSRA